VIAFGTVSKLRREKSSDTPHTLDPMEFAE